MNSPHPTTAEETKNKPDRPRFIVVGRTNEGKSSVVSTLVANDSIEISHRAGTTRECAEFDVMVDDHVAFTLMDSPGFENPRQTLEWLMAEEQDRGSEMHDRPGILRRFIETHSGQAEFRNECELLRPVLEGAGILYVVDGSQRFKKNYEYEMEILSWTSSDRIALINDKGDGRFVDQWKMALNQRFKLVRYFNAHRSNFKNRLDLLRALEVMCDKWSGPIENAVRLLQEQRKRQHSDAARLIARQLRDMLTHFAEVAIPRSDNPKAHQEKLVTRFHDGLRDFEEKTRKEIEKLHRHHGLELLRGEIDKPIFEQDLFAEDVWNVLGLTPQQLVVASALSGAALGGTIDVMVGGASFMTGALIGGVFGGVTALYALRDRFEVKLIIDQLSQSGETRTVRVGPHRNAQFPWVVLDRALLHYSSICNRAHSNRDVLDLSASNGQSLVQSLEKDQRARLQKAIDAIRKRGSETDEAAVNSLADELVAILSRFDESAVNAPA